MPDPKNDRAPFGVVQDEILAELVIPLDAYGSRSAPAWLSELYDPRTMVLMTESSASRCHNAKGHFGS